MAFLHIQRLACCCCCCSVIKLFPTLWDTTDCSPSGSSVLGISQARILEWVLISFTRVSSWPRDQTRISCIIGRFFTAEPPGKPMEVSLLPMNNMDKKLVGWFLIHRKYPWINKITIRDIFVSLSLSHGLPLKGPGSEQRLRRPCPPEVLTVHALIKSLSLTDSSFPVLLLCTLPVHP